MNGPRRTTRRGPRRDYPELWQRYLGDPTPGPRQVLADISSWADPIVDGHAWFDRIFQEISTCTGRDHCLYIAGWAMSTGLNLRPNDPSTNIQDLLLAKAAAGVDVRVLLYAPHVLTLGGPETRDPFFTPDPVVAQRESTFGWLIDANINTAEALRTGGWPRGSQARPLADRVILDYSNDLLIGAHHMKMTLVRGGQDNTVTAFCGGIDYLPDKMQTPDHMLPATGSPPNTTMRWHDVGVVVRGGAAGWLWRTFNRRWYEAVAVDRAERRRYQRVCPNSSFPYVEGGQPCPPVQRDGTRPGRVIPLRHFNPAVTATGPVAATTLALPNPNPPPREEIHALRVVESWFPFRSATRRLRWSSGTLASGLTQFSDALSFALRNASRYIYIEDQDPFLGITGNARFQRDILPALISRGILPRTAGGPYPPYVDAISTAVRTNPSLKVVIVKPGDVSDDPNQPRDAVNDNLRNVARRFTSNVAVCFLRGRFVHSKLVLIDDYFFSVGSTNLSTRSALGIDVECSVVGIATDRGDGLPNTVKRLRLALWAEHLNQPLGRVISLIERPERGVKIFNPAWGGNPPLPHDLEPVDGRITRLRRWAATP